MKHPLVVAATIAGGGIGGIGDFMVEGEKSEDNGDGFVGQLGSSTTGFVKGGIKGTMIGGATTGTVAALRHILGK